jgi:hypothetical protein
MSRSLFRTARDFNGQWDIAAAWHAVTAPQSDALQFREQAMLESRQRSTTMDAKLKELYQQQLALPAADRLKLIEVLAQGLNEPTVITEPPKRSLLEL